MKKLIGVMLVGLVWGTAWTGPVHAAACTQDVSDFDCEHSYVEILTAASGCKTYEYQCWRCGSEIYRAMVCLTCSSSTANGYKRYTTGSYTIDYKSCTSCTGCSDCVKTNGWVTANNTYHTQMNTTAASCTTSTCSCSRTTSYRCMAGYKGSPSSATGSCTACAAGTYSSAGSTSCTSCSAGQYASGTANTSCKSCPKGTYNSQIGQAKCTNCGYGKYNPNTGSTSSSACSDCPLLDGASGVSSDTSDSGAITDCFYDDGEGYEGITGVFEFLERCYYEN